MIFHNLLRFSFLTSLSLSLFFMMMQQISFVKFGNMIDIEHDTKNFAASARRQTFFLLLFVCSIRFFFHFYKFLSIINVY